MSDPAARHARALTALEGLSVGDALGERFFCSPDIALNRIERREVPPGPWRWTDDTLMGCSVVEVLVDGNGIDESALLASFTSRLDIDRGYGPAAIGLLLDVRDGFAGPDAAAGLFGGMGSFGNGAAMRVAPLGAWHAGDDLELLVEAAERSARPTHTHPEGIAGAIAVARAAALAWSGRADPPPRPDDFLAAVAEAVPTSAVAEGLLEAAALDARTPSLEAALALGSGFNVAAHDTVPFALWAAAAHLDDFEEAFWKTVAGLGDRDTTCAIACGVVASRVGIEGIPAFWRAEREPLPHWVAH